MPQKDFRRAARIVVLSLIAAGLAWVGGSVLLQRHRDDELLIYSLTRNYLLAYYETHGVWPRDFGDVQNYVKRDDPAYQHVDFGGPFEEQALRLFPKYQPELQISSRSKFSISGVILFRSRGDSMNFELTAPDQPRALAR